MVIFDYLSFWVLLAGLLTAIYVYILNQFLYWAKQGVSFKKPHWLFGSFGDLITTKTSSAEFILKRYMEFKNERFGGVWQFHKPMLLPTDPALVRDVLSKDFSSWSSRGVSVNLETDPLSAHLVNLDGAKWKSVRAKLTPAFTSGKLKQMHHLLLECAKELERYLETQPDGIVEAREMSAKFTTDVIGSCAFGIEMKSISDEESLFRKMGRKIFELSPKMRITRLIHGGFNPLFKLLKLSLHDQDVTEFFLKITKDTIDYRDKNNVQRNDFIDLLRNLKNAGKPLDVDEVEFDDKLLAAQAFVFFAGGFETSSTVISYCLHELAVNEDVQNRLRKEIHETKAACGGEITWDGLKDMKYLDMVVQETLRKYPPIPFVTRTCVKPYRIPDTDVELPVGMNCLIPIYALHHDPNYFPDPDKFNPERFTAEAKSQRVPGTFIPFGGGPRNCIGSRFGEMQTKSGLAKLVDTFKISLTEKSQNPLQFDTKARFLSPKNGIWIRITKNPSN